MKELLGPMLGEPVAVFCARYIYRGILARILDDAILLTNPHAVEMSGISTRAEPQTEDRIPSDLVISLGAVEIVFQPTWAFYGMEKTARKTK